jgi:hypothetical protein
MADTAEFSAGLLNPDAPVPSLIKGQVERRYAVYRNNVTVGLIRALEANFPAVQKLLGDEYFAGFAREFAQAHPPTSPLMFCYGQEFPDALSCDPDLLAYPYLKDVAQLEILWRESYHAADAESLQGNALSAVDSDMLFECSFMTHPALRIFRSDFAVHDIFVANRISDDLAVSDPSQNQRVMVTRPTLEVKVHKISHSQFEFFTSLALGTSLGAALNKILNEENFDLSETLTLLIRSGAFQSIQKPQEKRP